MDTGAREEARQKSIEVFFCYAREDEALLNKLKTHLRPLQRQGLIDVWYDREISAGTEWEQEIKQHLNTAQIILLLVSPDFMDSDYCYGIEMTRAIERHKSGEARVIPIILRWAIWKETPIGKLQALPTDASPITSGKWHDQDEAFHDVAEGIREAVEARLAQEERVRKAGEDRRRQVEAERTRLAEEEQERLRRAEHERRRQAEEETKAHQAEEGRIELRSGTREEDVRWFQRLDWKALRDQVSDPYSLEALPRMVEDHGLPMERVSSEEVQRFQRLDNAVRAWFWYSIHTHTHTQGVRRAHIHQRDAAMKWWWHSIDPHTQGEPSIVEVVRAWIEENPGFQLEQRPLRDTGFEMTVWRGEKPVFRIRLTNTWFVGVRLTSGTPLRPADVARIVMVVGVSVLNLLGTSVGLGILVHAWWIAVICLIGETYLVGLRYSFVDVNPFYQRNLKQLLVPLLLICIAWGLVGWFLNPFVSIQVHFPYSNLVLAAVGFLLGLFVNFFICYRLACTLDWYHRLERRLEG